MKILAAIIALALECTAYGDGNGIKITTDPEGRFEYTDNFATNRFLTDACSPDPGGDCWHPGGLVNSGPNTWSLIYRFYGDRAVKSIDVTVQQNANGPNLGAVNTLALSSNGLDWTEVATSGRQKPDPNGWQGQPLTVRAGSEAKFAGKSELWLRISLMNTCGLKTGTSNTITALKVKLDVGDKIIQQNRAAELDASWRAWEARKIAISFATVAAAHSDAPCYGEETDGRLLPIGRAAGKPVILSAAYQQERWPLSLAMFVDVKKPATTALSRIKVRSTRDAARKMYVFWDGRNVGTFDTASYLQTDRFFTVALPAVKDCGRHELRVASGDSGSINLLGVSIAGDGAFGLVEKPRLPAGGPLEVLSAYYMADPPPPADSQAVEGRRSIEPGAGLVFAKLQQMCQEHADFGGVRVLIRNNGKVPVDLGIDLI